MRIPFLSPLLASLIVIPAAAAQSRGQATKASGPVFIADLRGTGEVPPVATKADGTAKLPCTGCWRAAPSGLQAIGRRSMVDSLRGLHTRLWALGRFGRLVTAASGPRHHRLRPRRTRGMGSALGGTAVDQILRSRLIEALTSRRWTPVDAERAAEFVAGLYHAGEGEWKVWPSEKADHYRVARRVDALSVYDSPQQGRTRDVAHALNEVEGNDSDATGTH